MNAKVKRAIQDYLVITLSSVIFCLNWAVFILPNNMVSGGLSGVAAIIQYTTGFNMSYSYAILNVLLLLVGSRVLGKGFGAKTIYAVIIISVGLRIFPDLIPSEFTQAVAVDNGKLLCAIIGGAISGMAISIMMLGGGSSGGTDIIALMISRKFAISTGTVIMLLDIVIIASSLVIPEEAGWGSRFATVLFGYVLTVVDSITLDYIQRLNRQSVQLFIFSKKYENIADRMMNEMNRGVSILDAQGWYSKEYSKVVMIVAKKQQLRQMLSIIKSEDPAAFTTIGSVAGVYGEGFDRIKQK